MTHRRRQPSHRAPSGLRGGNGFRDGSVHQLPELGKQILAVVRAGGRLGVVLHAEGRVFLVSHAFDRVVVQIAVRDFQISRER